MRPSASAKQVFRLVFENRRTRVDKASSPSACDTDLNDANQEFILKHSPACTLTFFTALLLGTGAHAAGPKQDTGFYAGGAIGRSSFSFSSSSSAPAPWGGEKNSKAGTAYKLYGGYRLTEHFGVEAGYARLGRVSQWRSAYGASTLQSGSGQAFYAAATARLPLGDSFAVNGRLGIARGRISGGDNGAPGDRRFSGSANGVMAGFGAEYRVTQNLAITADYDYFGKLSKQAKGGMLTVGVKASF